VPLERAARELVTYILNSGRTGQGGIDYEEDWEIFLLKKGNVNNLSQT
jgi:hypothetical protein